MKLTTEAVITLARQAHFTMSPEEVERFRAQLNAVLEQMAVLHELADIAAETALDAETMSLRLRGDGSSPDPLQWPLERLSADLIAGFFTVPRMMGGSGPAQ